MSDCSLLLRQSQEDHLLRGYKKVKVSDRDLWPVVVDAKGVIVWLPGLKKSKYDKKKSENYDIILRYS